MLPVGARSELGSLADFILRVLVPRFDVVLSYDLGNGIRVEAGEKIFADWPFLKEAPQLPKAPRAAVETLTQYFRYCANLARLGRSRTQVACVIKSAQLLTPAVQGGGNYDLSAIASLMRDWSSDTVLTGHDLATFLVTENLNDLHPLLVNNTRSARVNVPLPPPEELAGAFKLLSVSYPTALSEFKDKLPTLGAQMAGVTLAAAESLLKTKEYQREKLCDSDLVALKKELVENDCNGLIEFIEPRRTLDDIHAQEKIKTWLRQDVALWKAGDLEAMPKDYLLCGPVGTGKTFLVECLAGEAGAPVVKLKNFRDKWVGSTEGNLEKIFRLLHALGRCFVFIDEADQSLGKRESGGGDSGVSGRVYSFALRPTPAAPWRVHGCFKSSSQSWGAGSRRCPSVGRESGFQAKAS